MKLTEQLKAYQLSHEQEERNFEFLLKAAG